MVWGDLDLGESKGQAWLTVRAGVSKTKKTDTLHIRADLAAGLRAWRLECGNPPDDAPVFTVPVNLVSILRRDLKAAGIDPTGLDVHALRHTTATHLAKAGVAPRTAQSIMRHSDIRLTLGTYTDPRLLDTASALDALPSSDRRPDTDRQRATGTYDTSSEPLGVQLGGMVRPGMQKPASGCSDGDKARHSPEVPQVVDTSQVSNDMQRDSQQRATRLERATISLEG